MGELLEAQEAVLREELGLPAPQGTGNNTTCATPTSPNAPSSFERRLDEEQADKDKVNAFLKSNGFADVDTKRTRLLKSCHPLHVAVSQNNAEMVQLLLA